MPPLSQSEADALKRSQNQFKGRLKEVRDLSKNLGREGDIRKVIAVLLKVAIVVCGIIIASGLLKESAVQIIGVVVLIVVAVERVFANIERLMAVIAAKSALDRIERRCIDIHESDILKVIPLRDPDPSKAASLETSLTEKLRKELATAVDQAIIGLENKDLELLGRLVLEDNSES